MTEAIPFNRPPCAGAEERYVLDAMQSDKISGDGHYSRKCESWFERTMGCKRSLLTPSCTQALEMSSLLIDIRPGDEVIMPSYTFVSTANAFVLRGAKIIFVDIRQDTLNIDENLIEAAITEKTKAIVPVHYAGVACNMGAINDVADSRKLYVIEDAAQGIFSTYKGRPLGTLGHLGAFSFHETKNLTSGGEGGLLIINDGQFTERAEIIREKGTNRSLFFRGVVDKYSWVDVGSSYLPSELQTAYLWGQIERGVQITQERRETWRRYYEAFRDLAARGVVEVPTIPPECEHNGHMFYLKCRDLKTRTKLLQYLKGHGINAVFHYVPLHSSPAGQKYGAFHGQDRYTTVESNRLLRLPLWYGMGVRLQERVINAILEFEW